MIFKILKGLIIPGLIIPILIGLLFHKSSKFPDTEKYWNRWLLKNIWAYILIITTGYQIYTEYKFLNRHETEAQKLVLFNYRDFEKELETDLDTSKIENKNLIKDLLYKFQMAEYAFEKADYKKHNEILKEIISGEDEFQKFKKTESHALLNNLAVVTFYDSRNKGFKCSNYLFRASQNKNISNSAKDDINKNLQILDKILNEND